MTFYEVINVAALKIMDNKEWQEKYKLQSIEAEPLDVPPLLFNNTHLLAGGKALDIAMGKGQNTVFLASRGFDVTGIDSASSAVSLARTNAKKKGVSIKAIEADILTCKIGAELFDVILNFYFLESSLIPKIKKGLKRNGLVFFETYTADQPRFGRPHNPDFLLKPNELLSFFSDFFIIFYHERIEKTKAVASLIAQKL